jgi:serine/threonine protein phosphatase PrpC
MMNDSPSTATWRVLGASAVGTNHQHTGRNCEDAHAYRNYADMLLLATADGAGSASQAATGAQIAVQSSLDAAERILREETMLLDTVRWQSILPLILTETHTALKEQAQSFSSVHVTPDASNLPLRQFATTLLFAAITPQWLAVAQIGDGAIVVLHPEGTLTSLTSRESRMYVNETVFITDTDYLSLVTYTILPRTNVQGIALLTDGLQMIALKFPENTPHEPFFTPLFRFVRRPDASEAELHTFLASERVCQRSDDDKTLLLAVQQ